MELRHPVTAMLGVVVTTLLLLILQLWSAAPLSA
jgi:hypothetical protein